MIDVLLEHARDRGVRMSDSAARRLLAQRPIDQAIDHVSAIGSLLDLASAFGVNMTLIAAYRRLDAVDDDYELAAGAFIEEVRARRRNVFNREWSRLEAKHFAGEARRRHASLFGEIQDGPLGWRTMMLLAATRDAGLHDPDADAYRDELARLVDAEVRHRYPDRRESTWQVVDPDSRHNELVETTMRDEDYAKRLVLARAPELQQKIDALATSSRMRNDVERVLARIRRRLSQCITGGWEPSPERYRLEVIEAAADAARVA